MPTTQLDSIPGIGPTRAATRHPPSVDERRDRQRAVYVAATRAESRRLYRAAAKVQAAKGYTPVSAAWTAGEGLELLTVTYLLDPARAANAHPLPMPAGEDRATASDAEPEPAEPASAPPLASSRPTLVALGIGLVAVAVAVVRTLLR